MTRPFRRRVLYIPGYDPIPPRRYREIYRREGAAQARISGYALDFVARRDRTGFGWGVSGDVRGKRAETDIEVLVWGDVVQRSMGHSVVATYGQMLRTAWIYLSSGALPRMLRLRRGPVIAALYPVVMLVLQAGIALLVAALLVWAVAQIAPWWAGLLPALAAAYAVLANFRRIDGRFYAYYLMHDFAFAARHRGAYPPALEDRIAVFADRIAATLRGDWDEVLVVGHSSGAYLAVSVLADLVRADRVPADRRLALLTLGHVVPMASFLPRADRLRADLHDLSAASQVTWVDVTAPGDACCFGLCDPVAVSGVEPPDRHGPLVLSAAFRQTLSPQTRRSLRGRWFRLHFQYLHAFDRPRDSTTSQSPRGRCRWPSGSRRAAIPPAGSRVP